MKKFSALLVMSLFLISGAFAAPTDDEVAESFMGVIGVYSGVFLSTIMGQTVPGASIDMNMQTGESSLTMENVDVAALFLSLGETVDGDGDMPPIPFQTISGSFTTSSDSAMELSVTLGGGPVRTLDMKMQGEELVTLTADGKNYTHLTDVMDFLEN